MTVENQAWVNGRLVAESAAIAAVDAGFLWGLGAFETMAGVSGRLPLWQQHLRRLEGAAKQLQIPFAPVEDLQAQAESLLKQQGHGDDILRLSLSAGVEGQPTWCMISKPRQSQSEAVKLAVSPFHRHPSDPTAALKCTAYAFHILARKKAQAQGADDALLLNEQGQVLETSTGNLWFLAEDNSTWCTPALNGAFLGGIAREVLLASLAQRGMAVQEGEFTLADLQQSPQIVVSNAVYGPRPAVLLGGSSAQPSAQPSAQQSQVDLLLDLWQAALTVS